MGLINHCPNRLHQADRPYAASIFLRFRTCSALIPLSPAASTLRQCRGEEYKAHWAHFDAAKSLLTSDPLGKMSHSHVLPSLSEREAVADAMYRGLIGFDRYDAEIFNSAFAGEDISLGFKEGDNTQMFDGLSYIRTRFLDHVGPMDTTHMTSNVRVNLKDGARVASITALFSAQHCRPGEGRDPNGAKYVVAGEYFVDLIKDEKDGLWKVTKWVADILWRQGDATVMQRSE